MLPCHENRVPCKIQTFSQNQFKSKQGRKMFLPLVDIVVFCCVSNIGLVKYAFISMDPVSLKPNVMVTCAIKALLASYFPQGSSFQLLSHQESIMLYYQGGTCGKGRRNEETWSQLARARADPYFPAHTPGPGYSFYGHSLMLCTLGFVS